MFRFTIRELALLTVIVALVTGWAIDHSYQLRQREMLFLKVVDATDRLNAAIYGRPIYTGGR